MKNALNNPRHSFCTILFRDYVYVIAGRGKDDYLSSIERIATSDDNEVQTNYSWEILMIKNPTTFKYRKACSCIKYDDKSFLIFGGKPFFDSVLFDVAESKFTVMENLALDQRDHFFTNIKLDTKEFVYIVSQLWSVHIFDRKEHKWLEKIPIPNIDSKPQINPVLEKVREDMEIKQIQGREILSIETKGSERDEKEDIQRNRYMKEKEEGKLIQVEKKISKEENNMSKEEKNLSNEVQELSQEEQKSVKRKKKIKGKPPSNLEIIPKEKTDAPKDEIICQGRPVVPKGEAERELGQKTS